MRKFILVTILFLLAASFYWFSWRPTNIVKQCFAEKSQVIQKRHDDNLNYYFVDTSLLEAVQSARGEEGAGSNRPMLVKDLNARLDEYWGEVAYQNCLRRNGLE